MYSVHARLFGLHFARMKEHAAMLLPNARGSAATVLGKIKAPDEACKTIGDKNCFGPIKQLPLRARTAAGRVRMSLGFTG